MSYRIVVAGASGVVGRRLVPLLLLTQSLIRNARIRDEGTQNLVRAAIAG